MNMKSGWNGRLSEDKMKIIVDEIPKNPADCLFGVYSEGVPVCFCLLNNNGQGLCCLKFSYICPFLKRKKMVGC